MADLALPSGCAVAQTSPGAADGLDAWGAAVVRVDETKAAYDTFAADKMNPLLDAHDRGEADIEDVHKVEREAADIASLHAHAVNAMTIVPAPTLSALHYKLTMAHADRLFDGTETSNSAINAVIADLARLVGLA